MPELPQRLEALPFATSFGILSALVVTAMTPVLMSPAFAQKVSDPTRLGAFSGAMRFCEERYGGSERRFRFARLRVAGAVDDMDGREKFRALAARDIAYERGQFMGNKLDATECKALLRLSEWKAFVD
jgi:hypothetical protein